MLHGGELNPILSVPGRTITQIHQGLCEARDKRLGITVQNEPMATQTLGIVQLHCGTGTGFREKLSGADAGKRTAWGRQKSWSGTITAILCINMPQRFWTTRRGQIRVGSGFSLVCGRSFRQRKTGQEAYPKTHLLFTEGAGGRLISNNGDWKRRRSTRQSMINDFNNGAEGWTDWNVLPGRRTAGRIT